MAREGNHFIRRELFSKAAVRPWACVALAGWIRLKNDEKALVYLTGRTAVLYVPMHQGYSILLIAVFGWGRGRAQMGAPAPRAGRHSATLPCGQRETPVGLCL